MFIILYQNYKIKFFDLWSEIQKISNFVLKELLNFLKIFSIINR